MRDAGATDESSGTTREPASSRTARRLRDALMSGELLPGQRLSEEKHRADLGVSRSTLREAYRLLIRDGLLVHHLSRGVFVRELSWEDVRDLYVARRAVQVSALRAITVLRPGDLRRLDQAVAAGRTALERGDWQRTASASVRFHEALVALAGSERLSQIGERIMAEFRLAYSLMGDTSTFHEAFFHRNEKLARLVSSGDLDGAVAELEVYLSDSERALQEEYDRH